MKRLRNSFKSTAAITLVVMLLLSMMSGVFMLSASAAGEEFPVIKNEPTMNYRQPDGENGFYTTLLYRNRGSYLGIFQTISILVDDTESLHKISDINNIECIYSDSQGDVYGWQADYYYSQ